FSKEHSGFAMGLAGLVIQFAPAIGPTVTGFIIDQARQRVPFIIIVGLALFAFIFGLISISSYNEVKYTKLDNSTVVYSTFGFGLMLYPFSSSVALGFIIP
ncbi:MFS transporter, partial [Staphylococcus aureus]